MMKTMEEVLGSLLDGKVVNWEVNTRSNNHTQPSNNSLNPVEVSLGIIECSLRVEYIPSKEDASSSGDGWVMTTVSRPGPTLVNNVIVNSPRTTTIANLTILKGAAGRLITSALLRHQLEGDYPHRMDFLSEVLPVFGYRIAGWNARAEFYAETESQLGALGAVRVVENRRKTGKTITELSLESL